MTLKEFESFILEHQNMVYTTALRLLGSSAEAEDMAQEAFVKAFVRRGDFKPGDNPGGWMRTVVTNLCLNHLQRHRKRWRLFSELETADGHGIEETVPVYDLAPLDGGRSAALDAALVTLPEAQRVPLVLFHFEDLSYEDIAQKLSVSIGKVKTDIHRGRQALRRAIGEEKS
ncbi:MAG: RNA polymerase sigma factor [Elusimicrobiota bacterium]